MKSYDQAYFDKWYRDPRHRVNSRGELRRKAAMVLATADFLAGRRIRTVLDVGCGEGIWGVFLKQLRPGIRYTGLEPSDYARKRFGRTRHILPGSFGGVAEAAPAQGVDLVLCTDVMNYLPPDEWKAGLLQLSGLTRGVAYLEMFSSADEVTGDTEPWHAPSPAAMARVFSRAGFRSVGLHFYVPAYRDDLPKYIRSR